MCFTQRQKQLNVLQLMLNLQQDIRYLVFVAGKFYKVCQVPPHF